MRAISPSVASHTRLGAGVPNSWGNETELQCLLEAQTSDMSQRAH